MSSSNADTERKLRKLGKRLRLGLMHRHDVAIPRLWVVEEVPPELSEKLAKQSDPSTRIRDKVSKSPTGKRVLSKRVSKRQTKRPRSKATVPKKQDKK